MTVGLVDVIGGLEQVARAHAKPALQAAGVKGVKVYPLGRPGMAWPALYVQPLPEGEGGQAAHDLDADVVWLDVCCAVAALNDESALAAAAAQDVLRGVYTRHVGPQQAEVALRRVTRRRGVGLSVQQFGGEDGPYCHVARVRLRVELLTPVEEG